MKVRKNLFEWTVFAGSAVLLAALVAALCVEAIRESGRPPALRVAADAPERAGDSFRVPITVRNEGDETAAMVEVEVVLERGGQEVERAELTFDFVPVGSSREGWAAFGTDPRCCRLVARVTAFQKP